MSSFGPLPITDSTFPRLTLMTTRFSFALAVLLAHAPSTLAQTIRPTQTGFELIAGLASDFRPATVFSYDRARDTLFLRIDMEPGDSLRCVYTGRATWMDRTQDPTTYAYNSSLQISTEHTWPQSHGAESGWAKSDMHHLFAVTQQSNSSRSNDAFAEVDDNFATKWFGPTTQTTKPDLSIRDLFSETTGAEFEPREDHKGDVARAMFYFYTLYRAQSDTVWFRDQVPTLLAWHRADPSTAADSARSLRIRAYQGTDNPYVLDSTLASRAFDSNQGGTLPVEWGRVLAVADGPRVDVTWETVGETNNATFTVETQPLGEVQWHAIGTLPGAGTTLEVHSYRWTADALSPGAHRFRIRQTDLDGAFAFSPIVEAYVTPQTDLVMTSAPNPFSDRATITVHLTNESPLAIDVFDALGRRVVTLADRPSAWSGAHTFELDGASLSAGVYVVRVRTDRRVTTQTLVRR